MPLVGRPTSDRVQPKPHSPPVKPSSFILSLILLASPASASAQSVKVPRPLTVMPDVKTATAVPDLVREAAPPREISIERAARAPMSAKKVEADPAPSFTPDFSAVRFDEPGDGALWVRGRTYKARFDEAGATYIPSLGSNAPRNFPVAVTLASVTVDGAPIALESGAVARDGDDVTREHGLVRETWHMGLESAEQTFVLDARPAGDVEIALAYESELQARATAAGVEFDGPHGGVRISSAVAIDAGGTRLALATRLEAGRMEIDLPASFSAGARYPLVIDPVYSTYGFETGANQSGAPDLAYSSAQGTWCAVYQFFFSGADVDVWAQDIYYGQPVAGTGMWVDYTSAPWYYPRIAYNALHDTFVTVAWINEANSRIMARAHYAHTTNQLGQVLVQDGAGGACYNPDIGGDPALLGPTYFFVVWTRTYSTTDRDIHGRLLDWNGTPLGSSPVLIENSFADDFVASISKTDGRLPYATQRWNIVWTRGFPAGDILGAQIDWDGTVVTPAFVVDSSAALDALPAASSLLDGDVGPRPWMATYVRQNGDLDVMGRVLVEGTVQAGLNISVNEYGAIFEDQSWPDVDTNGQRFVMTYCETYPGNPGDRDQYVTTMHWDGSSVTIDEAHVNIDYSTADSVQGQIAGGMYDANQGYPYYGLAWPRYGSVGDVYVGTYYESALVEATCFGDGTGSVCPCGNYGTSGRGCANSATSGAFLYQQGNPWLSADNVSLTAYGLPPTASCLFFQGTGIGASGTAFGDGLRCISGTVIRIGTKTASAGVAIYPEAGDAPISVKGLLPADGGWRGYQAWYRNAAAYCTPATFNMTSGMRIIWVR